jgi:succinate dehydrogenase / fumarate reductase cytochrome b subunit
MENTKNINYSIFQSTIGRKVIMAISGLILLLFLIGHMLGNTTIFAGSKSLNTYAEHIHSLGLLLWLERIVIFIALLFHIYFGIVLTLENANKKIKYVKRNYIRSTFSSRNMIYSGLIILLFLIYHILHFTLKVTNSKLNNITIVNGKTDVYKMMALSFNNSLICVIYITALLFLFLHLYHGISSFVQTLGCNDEVSFPIVEKYAKIISILILIIFISVPLYLYIF